MIDSAEEYRAEPGSGRNASDQTNIFPVDGGRRSELKSWRVHVKDRLQVQVAICEPVEVDDDATSSEDSEATEQIASSWDKYC